MLEPAPPRSPQPPATSSQNRISIYMRSGTQDKAFRLSSHLCKSISAVVTELVEQEYAEHVRLNGWPATP